MSLVKQSILERKTDCFPYQNSLLNNGEKFDVLQNNSYICDRHHNDAGKETSLHNLSV